MSRLNRLRILSHSQWPRDPRTMVPLPRPQRTDQSCSSEAWDVVNGYHREPCYPAAPEPTVEARPAIPEPDPPRRNPLDVVGIAICLSPVLILLLMILPFILRR